MLLLLYVEGRGESEAPLSRAEGRMRWVRMTRPHHHIVALLSLSSRSGSGRILVLTASCMRTSLERERVCCHPCHPCSVEVGWGDRRGDSDSAPMLFVFVWRGQVEGRVRVRCHCRWWH